MTLVTSSPDDLANKARETRQKNVGEKNKEHPGLFFVFLSHIFCLAFFSSCGF
jgi:hypothetical protein